MRLLAILCAMSLPSVVASAQSISEMSELATARLLELSSDGTRLRYQIGQSWWEVGTAPNSTPTRVDRHEIRPAEKPHPEVRGTRRLSKIRTSPDRQKVAYLDAEDPNGPLLLFCLCAQPWQGAKAQPLSRKPILDFQWAQNSESFWIITVDGADEPIGRMSLQGRFEKLSYGPGQRRGGGLAAANGVVAWVQSDGSQPGAIWVRDEVGGSRLLVNSNPQVAKWNLGTQEVISWNNSHGEELQGVLAKPSSGTQLPLIVDPYSSWRNRFLNIPVLGNYFFVKNGFAVFFPNHRAPHTFPAASFGEDYVGESKDRDPIDVLVDDVMTGVNELIRRGIADPDRLFLYSSSNGASAINQLLTETQVFRAAISHAGVADWLEYYRQNRSRGDETIPSFLGGRRPEDSPKLYFRISPINHVERIKTPLLLIVGSKDSRYADTMKFYDSLRKADSPATLVVYPDEGHEIADRVVAEQHVQKALEFFRSMISAK